VLLKLAGLCVAVLKFIAGDETAVTRYFNRNRERRGFQALSEGMLALASGEGHLAMAKAARAERYLNKPELTNLLTAQAAEMTGDRKKALAVYKQLLGDDKTRFVGVRGLMKQKLEEGENTTALKLAEKAFDLKPAHTETQDILLKLQAEHADWTGARKTLNAKLKHGSLPRNVHKRRDAVLALSEARGVLEDGKSIEAREAAIEANRLSPDLIPAAAMAARGYIEQGKKRYATRVLKKTWAVQPHPELAAAFAEIEPDETPKARIKRFEALTKQTPKDPETRMKLAELYIAADDFEAARQALGDLAESEPSARALTLMAAIERGQGADDSLVRGYLTRALAAPRGPQWVCDNCGTAHAAWASVCDNCSSFDTLSWKKPADTQIAGLSPSAMMPLLVDAPAAPEHEVETVEVAEPAVEETVETVELEPAEPEAPEEPEILEPPALHVVEK
jgi:HemY protein